MRIVRSTISNGCGARENGPRLAHQTRRPADANKKIVRPGNADLVDTPRPMTQYATGPDDQIVNSRRYRLHVGSADEDAERVVLRHSPSAATRLGKMNLAAPSGHDDIVVGPTGANEAKTFPKRGSRRQIIARNDGECADAGCLSHCFLP